MVWDPRLHGEPGGPTSITGTAHVMVATFYIAITSLSGHTVGAVIIEDQMDVEAVWHLFVDPDEELLEL